MAIFGEEGLRERPDDEGDALLEYGTVCPPSLYPVRRAWVSSVSSPGHLKRMYGQQSNLYNRDGVTVCRGVTI